MRAPRVVCAPEKLWCQRHVGWQSGIRAAGDIDIIPPADDTAGVYPEGGQGFIRPLIAQSGESMAVFG